MGDIDHLDVNKSQGKKIVAVMNSTPSKADCVALLDAAADQVAAEIPLPEVPGQYCFTTTEDRVVTLELIERTSAEFDAELIIWQ